MVRRWLSPRAILLHLAAVGAVIGCVALTDWQFHRAIGGNDLSWAYVFEWPLFGCCALYLWQDYVRNPQKRAPVMWASIHTARAASLGAAAGQAPGGPAEIPTMTTRYADGGGAPAHGGTVPAANGAEGVIDVAVLADFVSDEDDPKLAAYNRYLAELDASGKRKHW